jgi:uncharacterized protein YdaU (DUF1376 family)
MSRAWMPLYVADYLADTGHLSAAEHGAYLLLIMHYWQNGGLPNEDRRLARIARMSPDEWSESREVLFDLFDDGWSHHRIEAELKAAQEISEKAKDKAEKRWGKSRGSAEADAGAGAAALPGQMPETCQSQSQSHTPPDTNVSGGVARKAPPEHVQILDCLKTVLSDDRAKAIVDHRRKKKAPLTLHAATLLVVQFRQLEDPDKGADLMISRGWQGCEPEWCANAGLKLASSPSPSGTDPPQVFIVAGTAEWDAWREHRGKPFPITTNRELHAEGWFASSQWPPSQSKDRAA